MEEAGFLYQVISEFCTDKGDFSPEKISAVDMGYIFENLVRRFSESYNEEVGAHFTSRDIIYLMSDLLVAGDESAFTGDGILSAIHRSVFRGNVRKKRQVMADVERIAAQERKAQQEDLHRDCRQKVMDSFCSC